MANSHSGSITRIGTRVVDLHNDIQVHEIYEIELLPGGTEEEFRRDPARVLQEFLEQNGYTVNSIEGTREDLLRHVHSPLKGQWFHIVYWQGNPGQVCTWHLYYV